jgi:acetate---CoA ligase (ADP-forming)
MRESGMVVIGGTRQGLCAVDRVGRWSLGLKPVRKNNTPREELATLKSGRHIINEYDAKRMLAGWGIPVTREERVETTEQATAAANKLGYPVVLKVVSDAIAHKTELGLVAVNLKNEGELRSAFTQLNGRVEKLDPWPPDAAFLVQEFVGGGVEVFAGVSRDPDFGLSLAFGMGSIAIEIMRDFALRMLPLHEGDAEAMIAETRGAALLQGVRGGEASDIESLANCLYALGDFAADNADLLAEIDLNPIKVLPKGRGCVVVDALIVTRQNKT